MCCSIKFIVETQISGMDQQLRTNKLIFSHKTIFLCVLNHTMGFQPKYTDGPGWPLILYSRYRCF